MMNEIKAHQNEKIKPQGRRKLSTRARIYEDRPNIIT
jgi:hypothetical protein